MRKTNKIFIRALIVALLSTLCFTGAAAAGVSLKSSDLVYLGAFKHLTSDIDTSYPSTETSGTHEVLASPVLWEVRSVDHATSPTTAVIYSKYVVAQRRWTNSPNVPSGTALDLNAWTTSSDLRVWLNGEFLADFTTSEGSLMSAAYAESPANKADDKVTLPSVTEMVTSGSMGYTTDASTTDTARRVTVREQSTNAAYWLRSSGLYDGAPFAASVDDGGGVPGNGDGVHGALGVRPASQISLNPIIFKSGSGSEPVPYKLYTDWKVTPVLSIESGGKLRLEFPYDITSADKWPAGTDFTLSTPAGSIASVTSDDSNLKVLILSPDAAIAAGTHVKLTYAVSADATGKLNTGAVVLSGDIQAMNGQSWEIHQPNNGGDPDPGDNTIAVTGVTLNHAELPLTTGGTAKLSAIVTPSDATNKAVTWASSDPGVATVDASGNVKAVGPGSCTITATTTSSNKMATCTVTVTAPVVPKPTEVTIDFSGLGLDSGVLKLKPGDAVDLSVTATPTGTTFAAKGLPDGLTLTDDGHLSGTVPAEGTYTVTVTATAPDGTKVTETFVVEVKGDEIVWSSNGSSGCDAGFGVMALLALGLAMQRRR